MEKNALLVVDQERLVTNLDQAGESLHSEQELALDFTGVAKLDSPGLRAIENLVHRAKEKNVKVVLRGVNVSVYKTLKLARVTQHLFFESGGF